MLMKMFSWSTYCVLLLIQLFAVFISFGMGSEIQTQLVDQKMMTEMCPEDYIAVPFITKKTQSDYPLMCYKFFTLKETFSDAIDICEKHGGTLATPKTDVAAESLVHYILQNSPHRRRYWIGLSDKQDEGVFKWQDDGRKLRKNFTSWMITEPESNVDAPPGSRGEEQDCVKMAIWIFGQKTSAKFYDTRCDKRESFICEQQPILPNDVAIEIEYPSNYTIYNSSKNSDEDEVDFVIPKNFSKLFRNETRSSLDGRNLTADGKPIPFEMVGYVVDEPPNPKSENRTNTKKKSEVADKKKIPGEKYIIEPKSSEKLKKSSTSDKSGKTEERKCDLECHPDYLQAVCPLKYFPRLQHTRVVLNNATCRPKRNRTHLIVYSPLDACGTTIQNAAIGSTVAFRNRILVIPRGAGIVRNAAAASALTEYMILECKFPQKHSVQHGFQPADGKPQVFKTIKEGPPLDHAILLYKTVKYDCPFVREDYPVKIALSSRIYLEVALDMPSNRVEIHPINCFATPDGNPYNSNKYVLMQNGCTKDNTFRIEDSDSKKLSRISVEAFRFVGYFRRVIIHCDLIVCKADSQSSSECQYACNSTGRERRDSEEDNPKPKEGTKISFQSGEIDIVNDDELKDRMQNDEGPKPQPVIAKQSDETNQGDENSGAKQFASILLLVSMYAISLMV